MEKQSILDMYRSDDVKELMKALVEFDKKMEPIVPDCNGNYGPYTSLEKLTQESKKVLRQFNLRCIQSKACEGDYEYLVTTIDHAPSGQWIRSISCLGPKIGRDATNMQKYGSVQTYTKRYDLSAILGVEAYEVDLDKLPESKSTNNNPVVEKEDDPYITQQQRAKIFVSCDKDLIMQQQVCDLLKVPTTYKIKKEYMNKALSIIDELKAAKKG